MNPKVSIILPTYNGSKFIQQSIDSCLNQSFQDFELIIVDDCSTDQIPDIIKTYKDPRVKYFRNQTNQRLPRSLNIGFKQALGKYLTWTSDDNIFMPQAIEKMLKVLESDQGDFVYTDILSFKDNDLDHAEIVHLEDPTALFRTNCIRACFLYTRRVLEGIGDYDPDMELIEDYDYWVRISKKFKMLHIKEPLYYYRYHEQQLYTARNREIKIIEFLFKLKYDFMPSETVNWYIRRLTPSKKNFLLKIVQSFLQKLRIEKIFKDYQTGKISFTEARKSLNHMING